MQLSVNGQQLSSTHTLPQLLDVLDSFDVKALELWPSNVLGRNGTPEENERWENRDVDAAARLIRERGFTVCCVTLGFWAAPHCFASGGGAAFTDALRGTVDAAATFGAKLVNCYSTGIPLSLFLDAVRPAADYAASQGVVITLENEAHDESALPGAVAKLVDAVASPGFATQYDPCNYYHASIEPFPAAYETVQPHIRYVHLKGCCHYAAGRAGLHRGSTMRGTDRDFIGYLPLPDAAFPVEAIVRRLKRDNYNGFVTLEPHVPARQIVDFYTQEIPYLRGLLTGG